MVIVYNLQRNTGRIAIHHPVIGRFCKIPNTARVLLRFNPDVAANDFMAVQLSQGAAQANMRRWSTGTTAAGIQMAKMVRIPLVCPSTGEQVRAAEIASVIESRLGRESVDVAKLRNLKQGLMDDLLTGRVRTAPVGDA